MHNLGLTNELLTEILGYEVENFSNNGRFSLSHIHFNNMVHINCGQRADRPTSWRVCKDHIDIFDLAKRCIAWSETKEIPVILEVIPEHLEEIFTICGNLLEGEK